MDKLASLLLVGLSVGLGNFAAAIAIGLGGISAKQRLKVAIVFGLFETGMPIIGLLIGHRVAGLLGNHANLFGGGLLLLSGLYLTISAYVARDKAKPATADGWNKLLLAGLSLSIDNLVVGFSLGTRQISLLAAILVIGLVSISLSLLGLELGQRLGEKVEAYSELFSGVILLLVGVAIITGVL